MWTKDDNEIPSGNQFSLQWWLIALVYNNNLMVYEFTSGIPLSRTMIIDGFFSTQHLMHLYTLVYWHSSQSYINTDKNSVQN